MADNLERTQATLLTSGIQKQNNALYQAISDIIKAERALQKSVESILSGITSGISPSVTYPIVGSAGFVLLTDSSNNNLISQDVGEILTLSNFNAGTAPFASAGTIRWPRNASLVGRDSGDTADVPVLSLYHNGDRVQIGGDGAGHTGSASRIDKVLLMGGNLFLDMSYSSGTISFGSKTAGSFPQAAFNLGIGAAQFFVQGGSSAYNNVQLESPDDANALFPETGTPDLGTFGSPWKDGYFSGNIDLASISVASTPGASFSGAITNLTVVNGIVTAAS